MKFFEQKYFSGCPVCVVSAPKACWCFLVTRSAKPSGHSFREMPFSLPRPFASARLMALKNLVGNQLYQNNVPNLCSTWIHKVGLFFLALPNDEISNRGCQSFLLIKYTCLFLTRCCAFLLVEAWSKAVKRWQSVWQFAISMEAHGAVHNKHIKINLVSEPQGVAIQSVPASCLEWMSFHSFCAIEFWFYHTPCGKD